MANYKCKMCGGALDIHSGQTVVKCDFCGTTQTVPLFDNEKKQAYFNRANNLRLKGEFDKAAGFYELIVSEFPQEAEAYWGLILCKYGIEYVESNGQRTPTCHNTLYSSIFEDADYQNAIKYANVVARDIYEEESQKIDALQKKILQISTSEAPYDIFICYKESDGNGERTEDSVLATEIYKALVTEGYKVFFSRITLEGKLGTEFEPYIFSALHSARILLHVTTSLQNSNSVWVKNEWSRYLKNMDGRKTLIPCFKRMQASELPIELRNFQGQDFSKIGAMQDLLLGIDKILNYDRQAESRLLSKAIEDIALRDEYDLEEEYREKVDELLDVESFCAVASDIQPLIDFFEEHIEYKDSNQYLLEAKYQFIKHINSYEDCEQASQYLSEIAGYKDSEALVAFCEKKRIEYREKFLQTKNLAIKVPNDITAKDLNNAIVALLRASQLLQDATTLDDFDRTIIDSNHSKAQEYIQNTAEQVMKQQTTLAELTALKDNFLNLQKSHFVIGNIEEIIKELSSKIATLTEQEKREAKRRKTVKIATIAGIIALVVVIVCVIAFVVINKNAGYSAKNFNIKVTSKVNDKYNEELADGYRDAGYFYTFTFEVENHSPNDIIQLYGYMDINNRQGKTLSSSSIELQGTLSANSENTWRVQLNVSKGDNAREIWNTDISNLQITFRISSIYFADGTNKTYPDTKNEIVHDFE